MPFGLTLEQRSASSEYPTVWFLGHGRTFLHANKVLALSVTDFKTACRLALCLLTPTHGALLGLALGVAIAFLLLGSFGLFLVYASKVPLAFAVILLIVLALMFALGVQTGAKGMTFSRIRHHWRTVNAKAQNPPVY
jgi:CHASE2 domain-containing sensor protein